jgi:hypothetical protein
VTRLDEVPALVGFLFGFDAPEYQAPALAEKLGRDLD